jgi:hypothetical protein
MQELTPPQQADILAILHTRFEKNPARHTGLAWDDVQTRLLARLEKLWSLAEMERTGGEPDLVGQDSSTHEYLFIDCAAETPAGRRNLCYDRKALDGRKNFPPENSAVDLAESMGIDLLTEEAYRHLQTLGEFDLKTSSWLLTPEEIRKRGGAIFGDRRYDAVFIYHNGADSYYAVRGFRGVLRV